MKKRGQFYILIALVIGVVIFLIVSQTNIFIQEDPSTDIGALSENYIIESNKLINTLIGAKRENVSEVLSQATTAFVYEYARTRDPKFGLVYVFTNEDKAVIENYLDAKVVIDGGETLTNPEGKYELGTIELSGIEIPQDYTYSQIQREFPDLFELVLKEKFVGEVNVNEGDHLILDIEGVQYYFVVGDTVELNAVARRIEGGQIQIFQTQKK